MGERACALPGNNDKMSATDNMKLIQQDAWVSVTLAASVMLRHHSVST
jgi:hypothetical protein